MIIKNILSAEVENFTMQYDLLDNCIDWNKTMKKRWIKRYIGKNNYSTHSLPTSIAIDHYKFLHDIKKFDDRFYINAKVTGPVTIGFFLSGADLHVCSNLNLHPYL